MIRRTNIVGALRLGLPLISASLVGKLGAQSPTQRLPGAEGEWVLPSNSTLIAPYLGREALWLRLGPRPYRRDVAFLDGTIEFDVAPMPGAVFVGVTFRRESRAQYETVFFRPIHNGAWDAVQYMPRVGGASQWQLYPEHQAVADLPEGRWTHVRLVVAAGELRLYVGGSSEATLVVPRLRGEPQAGTVGFWARGSGDNWAAAISNVVIQAAAAEPVPPEMPPAPASGLIAGWEVSPSLPADSGPVLTIPAISDWTPLQAEEGGLVNLNRRFGQPDGRNTVYLRRALEAPADRRVPLEIGYSDEVTVFLNGEPLYSGVNRYESRHPGYLGLVGLGSETVYLPLRRGRNELIVAVSDEAFGWGLIARLPTESELLQ